MKRIIITLTILLVAAAVRSQDLSPEQLSALVQGYRTQLSSATDQIAQLNAQIILDKKEISDLQEQLSTLRKSKTLDNPDKK